MMHNVYNPLQTCKTQHKLSTTLSCHVQNYSGVCGRTLHAAVQKSTATVPPFSSRNHGLCKCCLKIQRLVITSHILAWFGCTFTLQSNMLIREAANSTGTLATSARQHGTNHSPKYGYLHYRLTL
jgi:hypothetical protein